MQAVKRAVFLAAGFGTRFLPATKASPKEMLPIVDTPVIQLAVEEAVAAGMNEIIIVTGRGKRAIEDHFDKSYELEEMLKQKGKLDILEKVQETYKNIHVSYVRQKEMKGTGDAVLSVRNLIGNEPFAVIFPDDVIFSHIPCLKQLLEIYEQTGSSVIAAMEVSQEQISSYGVLKDEKVSERLFEIHNVIEKPKPEEAPSNHAVIGRHILTPAIFDILGKQPIGEGGEVVLTESLVTLMKHEKVYAYLFEGKRFDTGSPLGFVQANIYAGLQRSDMKNDLERYIDELQRIK